MHSGSSLSSRAYNEGARELRQAVLTHGNHRGEIPIDFMSPRERSSIDSPTLDSEFGVELYRSSPPFIVTPLRKKYWGENKLGNRIWNGNAVKYYDEQNRQKFSLSTHDGKIYDAYGRPFHTAGLGYEKNGHVIFVMDEQGRFFASKYNNEGEFHHSSLVAGEPVATAGTIRVTDGILQEITNFSGHYKPNKSFLLQAVHHLRSLGVGIQPHQVHFYVEK